MSTPLPKNPAVPMRALLSVAQGHKCQSPDGVLTRTTCRFPTKLADQDLALGPSLELLTHWYVLTGCRDTSTSMYLNA